MSPVSSPVAKMSGASNLEQKEHSECVSWLVPDWVCNDEVGFGIMEA